MTLITDQPPEALRRDLERLRESLDRTLPAKALDRNLLIATWNLRAFGGLTKKWTAADDDSPKRDFGSVRSIAEVVSRFDVVALQEVKGNLRALRHMLKVLGRHWGLVLTDVTRGDPGNDERMAFVFDTRTVSMSGLACELVLPEQELDDVEAGALERQFARTPYAVSFRCASRTFILVTLHVLFGGRAADRVPELTAIARWLRDWALDVNSFDQNLVALGDFNIDRRGDALFQAFTSTGLEVPQDLHQVRRSIFADAGDPEEKFYDQIAWFTGSAGVPALSLDYRRGGGFDFLDTALASRGLTKQEISWRISDHYPLWVEFSLRE